MERPYEKFISFGPEKLSDAELLAIIIKAGTKDKTAVQLIQELMNKYDYANEGLAFCYDKGIIDDSAIKINPKEAVKRGEIAYMLYNLLKEANRI